jgi:membrane-associated phospholipid phosphatase
MIKTSKRFLSSIDIITLIYCGWILLYMSIGILRAKDALTHIPIFLSIMVSIVFMAWLHQELDKARYPKWDKALSLIRSLYPVTLFGYFYTSGYSVNQIIFTSWLDPFFMNIDQSIFGYLPSLVWGKSYDHYLLSELFHFAYFCYYPMILGLPVYLYFKKPAAFKELIFNLSFVFYLCYIIYSILPVIGGRFIPEAMALTQSYRGGPFTHIMVYIYRNSHHLGGAFPSSHIGIALVLTVAALRHVRRLGYIFVLISFFLSIATVYCHYHWFIDAVFGVLIGVGGYYLANYTHRKLQGAL